MITRLCLVFLLIQMAPPLAAQVIEIELVGRCDDL